MSPRKRWPQCQECGARLGRWDEYHPLWLCRVYTDARLDEAIVDASLRRAIDRRSLSPDPSR